MSALCPLRGTEGAMQPVAETRDAGGRSGVVSPYFQP